VAAAITSWSMVVTATMFNLGQWHDFFVMTGGGAAALTGLVFVAMTLNLASITQDATHRYRAIGTLAGFVAIFAICALALMGGQGHRAVGIEWLVVASVAAVIYVYGYVQAMRSGSSSAGLGAGRLVAGTACYVAEIAGAILLTAGRVAGLYVASVAMVVYLAFSVSGAWLLIVGVVLDQARAGTGSTD
jgi:hypothetical protein